jgi:hypothetical protein
MGLKIKLFLLVFVLFSCNKEKNDRSIIKRNNNKGIIIYDDSIHKTPIFKINIKDTIEVGKSTASIDFLRDSCNACDTTYNIIIINNRYRKKEIVKDTFMNEKNWFGINTTSKGEYLLEGEVIRIGYVKDKAYKKTEIGFQIPLFIKDTTF